MGKNIVWQRTKVDRKSREELLSQKAKLIWLTGLSGSGKSTLAVAVEERLRQMGKLTYLLDGDNIRHGINKDLGFSLEDRKENIRRISEVGKLFVDAGIITLASFISPLEEDRQMARDIIGEDFIEVYVHCPLDTCEKRDPKQLYKKARNGEIKEFTGITSPYEEPKNPDIKISTHENSIGEGVDKILSFLNLI